MTDMRTRLFLLIALAAPAAQARFEPVTCRNSFTQDSEIAEGNKVALQVYQQMPVLPESDPTTRYVQALGARLVQFAPLAQGVSRQWPFNFHVVASSDINAFALPGGSIFVNLGTVQAAETEAQLAGVIGHEISHVVMRHSTCNLAKQQRKGLFYGLGALGSAVLLGNSTAGQIAQTGIGGIQSVDFLHMSRDDEKQADLLGVNILDNTGYDPRGLPQFFETIQAKYGSGGAQFLSDHPNPGNRTEYVNAEIATLSIPATPIINTPAFREEHSLALRQRAFTTAEVKTAAWKQSGQCAALPGGNATIIGNTPVAGAPQQTSSPAAPMPRLTPAQLGINARLGKYQATNWSISIPAGWAAVPPSSGANASTATTLAPPSGDGSEGLAYGVLVATVQQSGNGLYNAADLAAATANVVKSLIAQDPALSQSAASVTMQVGSQSAEATTLTGTSPVLLNGASQRERDWLITVARPDGDLNFLVFVSPESDFAALRPLFNKILATFTPQ